MKVIGNGPFRRFGLAGSNPAHPTKGLKLPSKKFQKPLDKHSPPCYNIVTG